LNLYFTSCTFSFML